MLVAGLGVGVGAGLLTRLENRAAVASRYDEERSVTSLDLPGAPPAAELPGTPLPTAPLPAAATPREAVSRFLDAERRGDFARSFGFLASTDRDAFTNPSVWERQHGSLPTLTGFHIVTDDGAEILTDLAFEPVLDATLGLVAGAATGTFAAVAEDGGWRVAYSATVISQRFASDDGVVAGAQTWVDARIACDAPRNEWSGGVLGNGAPGFADALCHAAPPRLGAPEPIVDSPDIETLVATFGPEVNQWARTVMVSAGDTEFELVLAPVGEQWLVFGAINASPERSG